MNRFQVLACQVAYSLSRNPLRPHFPWLTFRDGELNPGKKFVGLFCLIAVNPICRKTQSATDNAPDARLVQFVFHF